MTSPARIQANRRNAQRSTGPKTAAGKAVIARNAVIHGAFATVPVLPGESAADWEAHRAGVVASLAPAGLLEQTLAERAALLLWRLARLARYEAATTAAALEAADIPPDPDPLDAFPIPGRPKPVAERAATARRSAELLRDTVAVLDLAAVLAAELDARPSEEPVSPDVASQIFDTAWNAVEDRGRKATFYEDERFLVVIGRPLGDLSSVSWSVALVRDGLGYYASCLGWPADRLTAEVAVSLRDAAGDARHRAAEAEQEASALEQQHARAREWRKAGLLAPADAVEAKVIRYEAHLSRQLQLTLNQLDRLRRVRTGEPTPPPLALDVNLSSDTPPTDHS